MKIIPLSRKYLEETTRMTSDIFPYDINVEHNPERSFRTSLEYEEKPELLEKSSLQKLNYWIVLSENTNEVIGVTGLYRRDDPDDVVWLGWYCVRADQRGRGFGRELLEWTINKARAEGYKRFKLYTSTNPNEAQAQELYEKLGFKIVNEEESEDGDKTLYREKAL